MKTRIVSSLFAILIASTVAGRADIYSLSSSSFSGGGGQCVGGVDPSGQTRFTLAGTVGQADAGTCGAGTVTLQGGFVPGFQKTFGPTLKLIPSGNALLLSWPTNSCGGFHLEASASVTGPWADFGEGIVLGAERVIAVSSAAGNGFFRLRKACASVCPQNCPE